MKRSDWNIDLDDKRTSWIERGMIIASVLCLIATAVAESIQAWSSVTCH